jgi:uncharacterized membrane protein required for colicin V production
MAPIDWIIVTLTGFSILLGLLRGVTRELLSLAGWIVGIVLAFPVLAARSARYCRSSCRHRNSRLRWGRS